VTHTRGQCDTRPTVSFPTKTLPLLLGRYSFFIPLRIEGWVDLSGLLHSKTVTNLSTKRDRRRVSLLTFTTPLPLSQTDKHFSACPSSWKIVPSRWRIIFRWADKGESCVTMVRTSLQRIACQHHWCVVMTTATNSSSSSGAEPGNIADRYISMPLSTALMNWQLACIMSHDRWAIAFGTARTVTLRAVAVPYVMNHHSIVSLTIALDTLLFKLNGCRTERMIFITMTKWQDWCFFEACSQVGFLQRCCYSKRAPN